MGEVLSCVQGWELSARAHLVFRGLSSWEASVTLYLGFWFHLGFWLWLLFVAGFAVLGRNYGWGSLWTVSRDEISAPRCASPNEVYPAGKLQWYFTCGFDFRHDLWLPFVASFSVLKGLMAIDYTIHLITISKTKLMSICFITMPTCTIISTNKVSK